ncbi:phosphatase PAP2 family protein [Flavobacteriaceae bacterium 14752]|uniref:phosphatase PAP2 family protein n=1 Tax=Mesohalobacter salilacus TaxID=2491711 RepID=UPI000F62E90D|nr:phosphatase PAP2 family protein [Flavobacteriaceae bacterium 14752]
METLVELDQSLFLYLNKLGSDSFDTLWLVITNKFASIPLYVLFIYLLFKNFGVKQTVITLLVVALMITITDQLSYAVKHSVMRLRPCGEPSLEGLGRFVAECGSYGYFSGHATSSFALAMFLGLIFREHYKYIFAALIVWALFVSYSRIYVGVHYPGDVLTGMLVGSVVGVGCYYLNKFAWQKFKSVKTDN